MLKKNNFGWIAIIVVAIMPIILWTLAEPWANRFYNIDAITTSLGRLAGLLGITIFAINLILSARLGWMEKYFAGQDKIYRFHHRLGIIAFLLLLVHPLWFSVKFLLFSTASWINFFTPKTDDWAINFGRVGIFLMILFLTFTFIKWLRYEKWRWTHKMLGIAFVFGTIHALIVPSDISRFWPLKVYVIILAVAALMAYIYHSWWRMWFVPGYKYQIEEIIFYPPNIREIRMKPVDQAMKYIPGQFVFAHFLSKNNPKETHPFSISSASKSDRLSITIKNLGDFTSRIDRLQKGDLIKLEGPFGVFNNRYGKHKEQIWIAGGIGITPFLGMARDITKKNDYRIDLYYAVGYPEEAVFLTEFTNVAKNITGFRVIPHFSQTDGYLTGKMVAEKSNGLKGKSIFLCGPPPMMRAIKKELISMGIPSDCIHSEEFELL